MREEGLTKLLKLGHVMTRLLVKRGMGTEIPGFDSRILNLVDEIDFEWTAVLSSMYASTPGAAAAIFHLQFEERSSGLQVLVLESQLKLLAALLSKIGVPGGLKHSYFTIVALMDLYDAAYLALARLQQIDRLIAMWNESLACIAADGDHISLELFSRTGSWTMKWLEESAEQQTLLMLTNLMASCLESCLGRYKMLGELDGYELADIAALILRLAAASQKDVARRLASMVMDRGLGDELEALATATGWHLEQETVQIVLEIVAAVRTGSGGSPNEEGSPGPISEENSEPDSTMSGDDL